MNVVKENVVLQGIVVSDYRIFLEKYCDLRGIERPPVEMDEYTAREYVLNQHKPSKLDFSNPLQYIGGRSEQQFVSSGVDMMRSGGCSDAEIRACLNSIGYEMY